jgi:hypothetical protein
MRGTGALVDLAPRREMREHADGLHFNAEGLTVHPRIEMLLLDLILDRMSASLEASVSLPIDSTRAETFRYREYFRTVG